MITDTLERLSDFSDGTLSPERLAGMLHIPVSELARLTGIHRNTLSRTPGAPAVQSKIGTIARILATAADMLGNEGKAVIWFMHQPLSGFAGQTAAELVAAGNSKAVLTHLEMLRNGGYA